MRSLPIYEELAGQRLTVVQVHDAWGRGVPAGHPQARWPLAGAVALTFETHMLFFTSPLRYLRSQQGTRFGMADGSSVDLGVRTLLCESAQAEALLWFRLGMAADNFNLGWAPALLSETGQRLAASPLLIERPGQPAELLLAFETGAPHRLAYRVDLNGAVEWSQDGSSCELDSIEVNSPTEPFGWLHPRAMTRFVVDDVRWKSAAQWPIEVRRQLSKADPDGPETREQFKRALLAYFKQTPHMLRRLLALRLPARVAGVPTGLIEEGARNWRKSWCVRLLLAPCRARRRQLLNQFSRRDAQAMSKAPHVEQREVPLPSLDRADIFLVKVGTLGQHFESQVLLRSQRPESLPKALLHLVALGNGRRFKGLRFVDDHTIHARSLETENR